MATLVRVLILFVVAVPLIALAGSKPPTCPVVTRNLTIGVTDAEVVTLKRYLASERLLADTRLTAYFGPLTQAALRIWQARHGIVSNGTPQTTGFGATGPRTRAALKVCGRPLATTANPAKPVVTTAAGSRISTPLPGGAASPGAASTTGATSVQGAPSLPASVPLPSSAMTDAVRVPLPGFLGVYYWGGFKPRSPSDNPMRDGAKAIVAAGFQAIRIVLTPLNRNAGKLNIYDWDLAELEKLCPLDQPFLPCVVRSPMVKETLALPELKTIAINTSDSVTAGPQGWGFAMYDPDFLSKPANQAAVRAEYRDMTVALTEMFGGSGKRFIVLGDPNPSKAIYCGDSAGYALDPAKRAACDASARPPAKAWAGEVAWNKLRQEGIVEGKALAVARGLPPLTVESALEIGSVNFEHDHGLKDVLRDMVPRVLPDNVFYTAHESLGQSTLERDVAQVRLLSTLPFSIGEWGYPSNVGTSEPAAQQLLSSLKHFDMLRMPLVFIWAPFSDGGTYDRSLLNADGSERPIIGKLRTYYLRAAVERRPRPATAPEVRDAIRVDDLADIAAALEKFHQRYGRYPTYKGAPNSIDAACWTPWQLGNWIDDDGNRAWADGDLIAPHDPVDTCILPTDGKSTSPTGTYSYWTDGNRYELAARLETVGDPRTLGVNDRNDQNGLRYRADRGYHPQTYLVASPAATSNLTCSWDGKSLGEGDSVVAYLQPSVPAGSTCAAETRICTRGALSGSYTSPSCTVAKPAATLLPAMLGSYFRGGYGNGLPGDLGDGARTLAGAGFKSMRIVVSPNMRNGGDFFNVYHLDLAALAKACPTDRPFVGCALRFDSFARALATPGIDTIVLTVDDAASIGDDGLSDARYDPAKWADSAFEAAVTAEFEDAAMSLYRAYAGTGKHFIFSNRETDNIIYCGAYDYVTDPAIKAKCDALQHPPSDRLSALIRYFLARKRGLDQARTRAITLGLSGVTVDDAIEFDSVTRLTRHGLPTTLTDIIPVVKPRYATYSAWESTVAGTLDPDLRLAKDKLAAYGTELIIGEYGYWQMTSDAAAGWRFIEAVKAAMRAGLKVVTLWEAFPATSLHDGLFNADGSASALFYAMRTKASDYERRDRSRERYVIGDVRDNGVSGLARRLTLYGRGDATLPPSTKEATITCDGVDANVLSVHGNAKAVEVQIADAPGVERYCSFKLIGADGDSDEFGPVRICADRVCASI